MSTRVEMCKLEDDGIPENIKELQRVAAELPVAPPLVFLSNLNGNLMRVKTEKGSNIIIPLHKSDKVAIMMTIGEDNTTISRHKHNEHEWLGVIVGKMIVTYDDGTSKEFGPNEVCFIPPNLAHVVHYPTYTEVWAITQPADQNWPGPVDGVDVDE